MAKASDAKRQFDYAKREKDMEKKLAYMAEGMSNLAQSVEHVSNTTVPLAKVAFAASLLAESIQDNLDNHENIIELDIRNLSSMREHDCSIAFAINDIPIWEHSGLSKMAAYNHAMTNLVDGGYYLESRKENNKPEFISANKNLKFIKSTKNIVVFQRISET